ncbi:BTAD domain-containing putative transcriptional regulator [Nocardia sp. CDC153]|uniref:AfsR/SARP family transcriptional regulator n=1 Tax=Nocardia sp. CDC153 TaxID=3112167 RepID=UPI002DBE2FE3|nr:BTAD domain-containing putative transcriptional regulator [Nocardia sp. CDC153]MEC3954399.1 BTAD domain-containing putative transcriptional regulator [Nocardia sp. CDC153]
MLVCRDLGPVEIEVDGVAREVGGAMPRRLLAALATGGGGAVEDSVLAELVWGVGLTDEVKNMMRVVVHRVRVAVGRAAVARTARGYALAARFDHEVFAERVEAGLGRLAAGDAAGAAEALEAALGLWRGEPFTELGDSLHVSGMRTRLTELRGVAFEELQAARLASGETARVIAAASEAVVETPFRERLWELLALGLYRGGRQAQALAELRRVRGLFIDELGVEPGPALRELERRMLAQDPELLPAAAPVSIEAVPEAVAPAIVRPSTRFIGRARESALLTELLERSRLVTVTGPGGVGKTRLVIEYAADRDDTRLVRLADVREAGALVSMTAAALGLSGPAAASPDTIGRAIADRTELLVLDNCEHLVDDLPELVLPLLARSPGLRILATGRRPTGIEGEQVLPLAPLAIGDASLELFLDRARAHRPDWRPSAADTATALEICTVLDGLPLAIELAAARVRSIGLHDLAERLRERLDVLGATPRGSISPHPSLAAAIGWSIDQLPDTDRALLHRLWPFEGGFDWRAAESVRDETATAAVFASLADLVDRSVLTVDLTSGHGRYRLLETIRRYCRQLDPDPTTSLAAHAEWARALIADQVALFAGPRFTDAVRTLVRELPNLRAAIAHDLEHAPLQALRSTGALTYFWVTAGVVPEGIRLLRAALAACPSAPAADRARALIALSLTSAHIGATQSALEYAEDALALLDDTDPDHDLLLLEAHLRRCNALADLGDTTALPAAASTFAAACDQRDAPDYLRATALWGIGIVEFQDGKHEQAIETLTRAHELSARGGFVSGAGITDLLVAWCLLADPAADRAVLRRALDLLQRAVRSFEQQPHFSDELAAVYAGSYALAQLGHADTAIRLHAAALAHADRLGTDPSRYLGFAGPDLIDRVRRAFDTVTADPTLSWTDMIALFTGTAEL